MPRLPTRSSRCSSRKTIRSSPSLRGTRWECGAPAAPALLSEPALQRSEEHTSELQSLAYLVCRLLLEKKKYHRRTIYDERTTLVLAHRARAKYSVTHTA